MWPLQILIEGQTSGLKVNSYEMREGPKIIEMDEDWWFWARRRCAATIKVVGGRMHYNVNRGEYVEVMQTNDEHLISSHLRLLIFLRSNECDTSLGGNLCFNSKLREAIQVVLAVEGLLTKSKSNFDKTRKYRLHIVQERAISQCTQRKTWEGTIFDRS